MADGLYGQLPDYIAVEGPIGVGKTTLARMLSERLAATPLLEAIDDNPFLERFYRDPAAAAFPTQLQFLMQRHRQLEGLRQRDLFGPALVADFMFDQDRLFAELNLASDELSLYDQVFHGLSMHLPQPGLVVYLQAPLDVLMERVHRRDRPEEAALQVAYLQRVAQAYIRFFAYYDAAPVLIVNTERFNPTASEAGFELILKEMVRTRHGRRYFNPSPLALD